MKFPISFKFPANMYTGDGDIACDQYHKYKVSRCGTYMHKKHLIWPRELQLSHLWHIRDWFRLIFINYLNKSHQNQIPYIYSYFTIGIYMYIHFLQEDIQLMAKMGLDAYRFSISWSRLIPGAITLLLQMRYAYMWQWCKRSILL